MMEALLYLAVLVGAGAAAFIVARSPAFWLAMGKELLFRALPFIIKAVKPRDFTPEERARIDRGEDPFNKRRSAGIGDR